MSNKKVIEKALARVNARSSKHNIDFIFVDKLTDKIPHPKWNKHCVFNYVEDKYEKIGMVDFDTHPLLYFDMINLLKLFFSLVFQVLFLVFVTPIHHLQMML